MTQTLAYPSYSKRRPVIVCQGDSLTDPVGLQPGYTRWTEELRRRLEAGGKSAVVRNIAQTGARTDDGGVTGGSGKQMLNRFAPFGVDVLRPTIPDIAILWGGANDVRSVSALSQSAGVASATVASHGWATGMLADVYGATPSGYNVSGVSLTSANANTLTFAVDSGLSTPAGGSPVIRLQTRRNLRAMVKWLKFGCRGCYRSQADLPAGGANGDRYVVLNDTSSTGGQAALTGQAATISGAATAGDPTVWEYRNGRTGELGWGRIAVAGTPYDAARGCNRIVIMGQHYLNWSSGGDALASPYALWDASTGIRAEQSAAAAAEGVVYGDLYAYLRQRIVDGKDVQGDYAWHYANSDVHFSQYGASLVADYLMGLIAVQDGWLGALA